MAVDNQTDDLRQLLIQIQTHEKLLTLTHEISLILTHEIPSMPQEKTKILKKIKMKI